MALLAAMVTLVTVGVVFRYVLNTSLTWYDEFAQYLLVWLSLYGAVVATYRNRHIYFDAFLDRVTARTRRVYAVIAEAFSIVFQGILLVYGWQIVGTLGHETAVSIEAVRMAWVYSVLPVTGGLMLLVSLTRLAGLLGGRGDVAGFEPHAASGPSSE